MITIKEHNGKRVLSNYNYNAVEKEILRLTDELERTEEVINYLLKKIDTLMRIKNVGFIKNQK